MMAIGLPRQCPRCGEAWEQILKDRRICEAGHDLSNDELAATATVREHSNGIGHGPTFPLRDALPRTRPHPSTAHVVRLSDVEPEQTRWLWPGRIPLGKLTIF